MGLVDKNGNSRRRNPAAHRQGPDSRHVQATSDSSSKSGLLSHEELVQALERHRAFTDRTDTQFVFLRLAVSPGTHSESARLNWAGLVAEVAQRRCRRSDVPGWHAPEKTEVGVILPDAGLKGALSVLRDIESAFRRRAQETNDSVPDLVCEVFVYPSKNQDSTANEAVGGFEASAPA